MLRARVHPGLVIAALVLLMVAVASIIRSAPLHAANNGPNVKTAAVQNAINRVQQGEQIFRFDTFGDQAFWGDTLHLHQAIEGAALGGVGPE